MPEQEGAQDQVAEAGLMGHDGAYLRDGNCQHPPGRCRHRSQVNALPGEHADFAQELCPSVTRDERRTGLAVVLDDLGGPVEHHDQVVGLVPVGEQHVASRHVALGTVPAQHIKLGLV
jgi:hypothetical protein